MKNYILHLETATKVCSVALSMNGKLLQLKEIEEDGYAHGEKLTLLIEDALASEQVDVKELVAVSVSSGPGSYTGLRIGVSTAKGLCYALGIPLIAIDSLLSIQQIAKEVYPNQAIAALIDARRMEVFASILDGNETVLKPISADVIEEDSYLEFEPFVACGDGAEKLREIWSNRNITIASNILSSAKGQVAVGYQKYLNAEFEDVAYFEPFYLKDFVMNVKVKKA